MFEKMMNMLENMDDCIDTIIHEAYWGGEEPSSIDIDNMMMVEAMLSIWGRQHGEFISRQAEVDAEDSYYLQLEARLSGVRARY